MGGVQSDSEGVGLIVKGVYGIEGLLCLYVHFPSE